MPGQLNVSPINLSPTGKGFRKTTSTELSAFQAGQGNGLISTSQLAQQNKQKQQQQNKNILSRALSDVNNDVVKPVTRDVIKPVISAPVSLAKDVNKLVVQPTIKQASTYIKNPGTILPTLLHGNAQANKINATYQANKAAGKVTPIVDKTANSLDPSSQTQMKQHVNQLVAAGTPEKQIEAHLGAQQKAIINQQNATVNKVAADVAGTASLGVGGGEVADVAGNVAKPEVEKLVADEVAGQAEKSTASKVASKVVPVAKTANKVGAAGAVSNASSVVSANPTNPNAKNLLEAGALGYGGGAIFGAGSELVGRVGQKVFGKVPEPEVETPKTPTQIAVTDKSTGATKGKVTTSLPTSTGAGKIPVAVRPSDAGFDDTDFRGMFNANAKSIPKTVPDVLLTAAKTHPDTAIPKDPLTLTVNTLADTNKKSTVGKIVDKLIPDMNASDRTPLVKSLTKTNDPNEVANLLFDAGHNQQAIRSQGESLVGTPMNHNISFAHPSDLENAQRQGLHVKIAQINKVLDNHENGVNEIANPENIKQLQATKQTAQDVLDGKTAYNDAYPQKPTTGEVKPLPFGGEAVEPDIPAKAGGIVGATPAVAEGDMSRQALVNRRAAMSATEKTFHEADAKAAFKTLSKNPSDVKLLDQIESKEQMSDSAAKARVLRIASGAKNPRAFIKVAGIMRDDLDTALAHRQALNPEMGKLSNYFEHFYDRGDKATADKLDALDAAEKARAVKVGAASYTKHRIIPTYADAAALGLKRKNANVFEDYLDSIHNTTSMNGRAALIKGLNEAHPGKVLDQITSTTGSDVTPGNLNVPGAHGVSLTDKDLVTHYNSRAPAEASNHALVRGYDKVNKGAKNTVLAGGAFHGTQSALTIAGQQLVNSIRHPLQLADNLRLIGDTMSKKLRAAHVDAMEHDGTNYKDGMNSIQRQKAAGLTYTDLAGLATDGKSQGILNKLPGLKQLHSMVFDRQLPAAKQMIFNQKTAGLDLTKTADLAKARKIAGGINYMIGGIDSATQGLSPKAMQQMGRVVLAADYTQGRAMTVYNALTKFGKNAPEGRLARQAVVGKSIVTAIPGLIALAASGKLNVKDPSAVGHTFVQQLIDPQIPTPWRGAPSASNPKGNPITLKLPSTYISEIGKIISPAIDPSDTFSNSRVSGLEDFASSRLAELPVAAERIATNKDFYGNPIVTGNAKSTALNIASQFSPIPVQQATKTAQGSQNVDEALLNEAGLKASSSTLPSDTQHAQRLNEFYNTMYSINDKVRAPLIKQINTLISNGQSNQAQRLAEQYNASLNQRLLPFRTKYANGYNPAFDKTFLSELPIKTSGEAFKTRLQDSKQNAALLQ